MTVKALIFDFDGLILDTESPIYYAIRDTYQQYGFDLPMDEYTYCIGSYEDNNHFLRKLEEKVQIPLDIELLGSQINTNMLQKINASSALPGVFGPHLGGYSFAAISHPALFHPPLYFR
jgi:putative hydrolase of the HAD superfamily